MVLPPQEATSILKRLPPNILSLCLNLLDAKDVVNCRNVCSALLEAVDTDINLRYKIELHASSMIDGPPSLIFSGARLIRLLEYQQRWRRCEWTTVRSLSLPALPKPDGTETTDDAIITRGTLSSAFLFLGSYSRFIQWRSHTQELEHLEWDVAHHQRLTLDLDFDARQDLLMVLEIPEEDNSHTMQLSVRHLHNGLPHCLAKNPQLASFMADGARAAVRIYDRYVTLFIKAQFDLECRLSIYDWKAGGGPIMVLWRHDIEAVTLISERYALLVELRSSSQLCLCIIDVHRRQNPDVCSLLLPETPTITSMSQVNVQCGPHSSPPHTPSSNCPLFTTDPENQLVLVTFTDAPESFALFTLASTLVKLAEMHQNDASPTPIPWEEWGPENTRLIETAEEAGENLCVYGTRALIVHEQTQMLYDFNQRSIKRELSRCSPEDVPNDIVTEASIFDREGTFSTVVTTSLPYRLTPVALDNFGDESVVQMGETSVVHVNGHDMTVLSI